MIEASSGPGSSLVPLEPWSPALDPEAPSTKRFRATSDGKLAVKVEPASPRTAEAEWRLAGRPGSEGRVFSLALPDLEVSSLVLDLPEGWVPEAKAGPRVGPEPGSAADRSTWRFEAARGVIDLRFRNPLVDASKPGGPGLWVEGTTRIDLNQSPTNWRADWTLDESQGAPQRLTVELDPGLELVDVVGPRVASFREEPTGLSTRVSIKLNGGGSGPSPLTLRAICHVPIDGVWSVPSARPIDATWTGGRTLLTLDSSRVLQNCVERSGRRVPPRPTDPAETSTLIFESQGEVGPVAELTLRRPLADATVDIRGHLLLGDDVPRIEVALTWTVERGRLLAHAVDLSPGWTPDRVLSSVKQPVPWHAEPLGNGGTRVHIGPALPDEAALMMTLTVGASAWSAGVTGPLDLPRVRPSPGVRVVDEVWAATPDPNLTLRPISGTGLAWIDPLDPPLDDVPAPWVAEDLKNAMAWRWLADGAEGRINRTLPPDRPRAEINLVASILNGRLGLDWSLAIESDLGDLRTIPIHLDEPGETAIRWRIRGGSGSIVEAKPIDEARRAKLGFPTTGSAWDLELSGTTRGRIQIEATVDRPWSGKGRIPILTLPDPYRARGLVTVIVADPTRLKVEPEGLTPIESSTRSIPTSNPVAETTSGEPRPTRRAALFAYRSAGGRLEVETIEDDASGSRRGLIRESFLVSQFFPGEGIRHRLTLRVAGDPGRAITLKMPEGAKIDRVRRDGQPVVVNQVGPSFQVEIPDTISTRMDSTLTIDYRTGTDPGTGPIEPATLLPTCSLPCLSFVWELIAPEPWVVTDDVRGLVATDPRPARSITSRLLGFHSLPWSRPDETASAGRDAAILNELDQIAARISEGETTLGDWLVKLDSGRWPLVIDRLALRSSGWGPGSRIGPFLPEAKVLEPVKAVLQPSGLVAIPLGGVILITSRIEGPQSSTDRTGWSATLRGVPAQGSDQGDRFQSAARWRGEATPRALAAGESLDRFSGIGGWHCRRLVTSGWPAPGASVRLIDSRAEDTWGWVVFSILLAGGILARNQSARFRAIALSLLGLMISAALFGFWPEPPTWVSGGLRGFLAVAALWVGRSFRPSTTTTPPPLAEGSTTSRGSAFLAAVNGLTALIATIGAVSLATAAAIGPDSEPPILALLVFDGSPDAVSKPDRVILSLKDAARLRRLARPDLPARSDRVSLAAASHRIIRNESGLVTVESRYEVDVETASAAEPAEWTMPVGTARDLKAEVDGMAAPIRITANGLSGSVAFDKAGPHAVVFRRSLPLIEFGTEGSQCSLPINRAAFARVSADNPPVTQRVEILNSSGPFEILQVRWWHEDRPVRSEIEGSVDATLLWDARPVGDLIRLRLTHSSADGASAIRLALEPGLVVRRHSIPNLVGIRQEGTVEHPEWVARVDPPLPKDVSIEVELWRTAVPGQAERTWPEIQVMATRKVSTLLGFRRPSDWSGRLEAGPGVEAVAEANFLKAWGTLDNSGLSLAGAVRFSQSPRLGVTVQPVALRRSIQSKVQLDLVPGRMNVVIEALVSDRQGRSFDLAMGLPIDLRLIKVEAVGLVDWQKSARDRLRIQFDGLAVPERRIRIEGYLPVPSDDVMSEARSYQTRVPWPRWPDPDQSPGTLIVSGATRFQLDSGEGVLLVPNVGPDDPDAPFRSTYRVDRPSGLTTVRWSAPAARFSVAVRSDLTIDPVSVQWTAVLTCDIAGGPADKLQWNLPTSWARNATLELQGQPQRLVAESKGAKGDLTQWTVWPEAPLWGRARLILRSKRVVEPGVLLAYPEIVPLSSAGRGSVDRYEVAIANVSGRELKLEGVKGLQPLDLTQYRSEESIGLAASFDAAYQVNGGRWSLGIRVGRPGDPENTVGDSRPTRLALSSVSVAIGQDGEVWGRARFELADRSGPFLAFELAEPAEIPWAAVDGINQPVVRDRPGHWLVPLGDGQPRSVSLIWHRPGPSDTLEIPRFSNQKVPTLVGIHGPGILAFPSTEQGFTKIDHATWEVESAERLAPSLIQALVDLNPGSTRRRERVINELVDLELRARTLSRQPAQPSGTSESAIERVRIILAKLDETSESSGLDDLFQEAQTRVGLSKGIDDPSKTLQSNFIDLFRVRKIGTATYFQSRDDSPTHSAGLTIKRTPAPTASNDLERWGILGVGALIATIGGRWIARPPSRIRRRYWLLLILGMGLGLAWEPIGMAAILGLLGLGRRAA